MIKKDLLKILVCPACKSPVKEADLFLICTNVQCRRQYAVKDNIPVMLVEGSEILSETAHQKAVQA